MKKIKFYQPTITEQDIQSVVDVLRSQWITTGSVNEQFSQSLQDYLRAEKVYLLNSATAGLFIALKAMGIGEGDEVITSPYTFAATANVILHTGAKVVFADVKEHSFFINPEDVYSKITPRTKAIIPVDFSSAFCYDWDYTRLKTQFQANNLFQEALGRPLILCDAAHSLGSRFLDSSVDMASFSFHAVKNITTAEGGALAIRSFGDNELDQKFQKNIVTMILHGQDRSARDKILSGNWEYDIVQAGYKFNLPDLSAALGYSQFQRYESESLPKRRDIFSRYVELLKEELWAIMDDEYLFNNISESSCHLFPLRIKNINEQQRNYIIQYMAEQGISCNVHYKPLTEMTVNRFYGAETLPYSFAQYQNEISLPFHLNLCDDDLIYIVDTLKKGVAGAYRN